MKNKELLQRLSTADLVGQVLCYDIYDKDDPIEVEKIVSKIKPGGIFVTGMTPEKIKMYTDMVNKYTKFPVIVTTDVENGPFTPIKGGIMLPHPMAWGACNDEKLVEEAAEITARICRKCGVHWSFSPCVDILYNFQSPSMNIRAISDDPDAVIRLGGAYMRGLQKNGRMIASCKHFPGDGWDDRNPHFLTTLNGATKEEWLQTYGKVFKTMFEQGCVSVMPGHISLPCVEDPLLAPEECLPATLSYNVLTKLLKGELGFDGCVVSDAMSMLGACMVCDLDKLAVEFLRVGGDFVLFPEPTDYDCIHKAVKNGDLSIERLTDAVDRVLEMKKKVGLFRPYEETESLEKLNSRLECIAQEIADKSIKVVRNFDDLIPIPQKKNGSVLMLNISEPFLKKDPTGEELKDFQSVFEANGYSVTSLDNPKHGKVGEIVDNYDFVLVNIKMSSQDYHGGTMRMGWNTINALWRGYAFKNKNVIVTSFGDPYKLYDMPYVREYINAFSFSPSSQRAAANVILGNIEAKGKNPVEFGHYFSREI